MCCTKGTAFLYCKSIENQLLLNQCSPVISHGSNEINSFISNFIWTGLQDYSNHLVIQYSIKFWKLIGIKSVQLYIHKLALWAANYLKDSWKTELITSDNNMLGSMICIGLPVNNSCELYNNEHNIIQDRLYYEFHIECPIKLLNQKLYVRISAHIYNTKQDYLNLDKAIKIIRNYQ